MHSGPMVHYDCRRHLVALNSQKKMGQKYVEKFLANQPLRPSPLNFVTECPKWTKGEEKRKIKQSKREYKNQGEAIKMFCCETIFLKNFKISSYFWENLKMKTLLNTKQLNKHCLVSDCDICLISLSLYHPIASIVS